MISDDYFETIENGIVEHADKQELKKRDLEDKKGFEYWNVINTLGANINKSYNYVKPRIKCLKDYIERGVDPQNNTEEFFQFTARKLGVSKQVFCNDLDASIIKINSPGF